MRSVPKSRAGIVGFYQIRADRWVERAQQLNIDPEHAAEVQELTHQAVQARLRQREAILAARSATLRYNNLVRQLGRKGASLLKKLQVQASSDESVYTHALIQRPRKKSRIGPPGEPYALATRLCATGALILKWKCRHPHGAEGTLYNIYRQLGRDGPITYLATVGKKRFTDATIPPGTASVTYEIRARRSTTIGPTATFTIRFGGGRSNDSLNLPPGRKAA